VRVLIVDDHPVVLRGARAALEATGSMEVATAQDAPTAYALLHEMRPDVVVVDLRLAGGSSGTDVIRRVAAQAPATRILVMSQAGRTEVLEALKAGAHGYVDKAATDDELVAAIRTVRERAVLPPELAATLLTELQHPNGASLFTARERDVLRCLAKGYDNREIAEALRIGVRTVNRHLENIRDKAGRRRRSELMRYAREEYG
jgi:DNA-binding NarL/FixJ family response regulator